MIEGKILTKKKFSILVENKVKDTKLTYIDACVAICEELEFDPEDVSKLITPSLFQKIQAEAAKAGLIKDSNTTQLPI